MKGDVSLAKICQIYIYESVIYPFYRHIFVFSPLDVLLNINKTPSNPPKWVLEKNDESILD